MRALWALSAAALLGGSVVTAQVLQGPTQDDYDLQVGQESVPADRNQGPPGEGPVAVPDPDLLPEAVPTPITGLSSDSPFVPRPAPGTAMGEEARRLAILPSVQTKPAYRRDRDGDGAAPTTEPPSFARGELVAMGAGLVQNAGNACITCHGVNGGGDGSGAVPRLAGLPAWYLAKQLRSYEVGTRRNEIMEEVVETLTPQDQLDVAAYYSAIEAPLPAEPLRVDPELLQHGARIGSQGLASRAIPACENCHAVDGAGLPPDVPYLATQYDSYIEAQLDAWVEGTRTNDEGDVMHAIAEKMTERDRRAVALYYRLMRPVDE